MKERIHFTKMHGCGNDYIYVDTSLYRIENPSAAAIAWSDRHKSIGSDGLVLIGRSSIPEADFTMRIFNADGSEAMMCGNASRCVGKYVYERGLTPKTSLTPASLTPDPSPVREGRFKGEGSGHHERQIRLLTLSGIKILYLHITDGIVESVTVDMGAPVFEEPRQYRPTDSPPALPVREGAVTIGPDNSSSLIHSAPSLTGRAGGESLVGGEAGSIESASLFVSMGNPHYVIFVDDVDAIDVAREGARLEHHPAFPERANIEFAEMRPDGIRVRVWERGSGITMACGTGACATAVAACKTGRAGHASRIIMDGGELEIEWRESDGHVYMTGPAEFVFEGEIELP